MCETPARHQRDAYKWSTPQLPLVYKWSLGVPRILQKYSKNDQKVFQELSKNGQKIFFSDLGQIFFNALLGLIFHFVVFWIK